MQRQAASHQGLRPGCWQLQRFLWLRCLSLIHLCLVLIMRLEPTCLFHPYNASPACWNWNNCFIVAYSPPYSSPPSCFFFKTSCFVHVPQAYPSPLAAGMCGGAALPAPLAPGSGWPAPHRPTLQLASQGRGRWRALAFVGGATGAGGLRCCREGVELGRPVPPLRWFVWAQWGCTGA